jgi:hypothetical protein
MCLNLCHSLVPISFQSVYMCCSAWMPHVSFSLQNSIHSLSSSSHRLTLSHTILLLSLALLFSHCLTFLSLSPPSLTDLLSTAALSGRTPSHPLLSPSLSSSPSRGFSLPILPPAAHHHIHDIGISLSLSLSLHLSLINPISHFFVTLPEIEIGFWLHFSLHACFEFIDLGFLMNLSLLRVNFWVLLTLFCD